MRIAHLLLTSRFAGSERYAIELANAQAALHDVTLVLRRAAARDRPDALRRHVSEQVRVEVVGDLLSAFGARRVLRRLQPDVAHAHLSAGCKALGGMRGNLARVASLHIAYKPQQHARLDGLIAIAPWQMDAIPEPLCSRSVQIDNWTLPQRSAADARARLRREFGVPEHATVIGAMGRLESSKGFDVLLDAFARAELPDAWLVIVGSGSEADALRRRAGTGNVVLPGFTTAPQDWLACFDLFVSAARSEPFGLVMLEAMEAGLPILATASHGARHLAGAIGRELVPIDDVAALAQALKEMASKPLGRIAYPLQRFRLEDKLPQFERFYAETLARVRSGG